MNICHISLIQKILKEERIFFFPHQSHRASSRHFIVILICPVQIIQEIMEVLKAKIESRPYSVKFWKQIK